MLKSKLLLAALIASFSFGSAMAGDGEEDNRGNGGSRHHQGRSDESGSSEKRRRGEEGNFSAKENLGFDACQKLCAAHLCEDKEAADRCFDSCKGHGLIAGPCAYRYMESNCIVYGKDGKASFFKPEKLDSELKPDEKRKAKVCRHASFAMSAFGVSLIKAKGIEEFARLLNLAKKIKDAANIDTKPLD